MRLGEIIAQSREARQISPATLARRANVTAAQISRLESGEQSDPHLSTIARIAHVLDLSLDDIADEMRLGRAKRLEGDSLDETAEELPLAVRDLQERLAAQNDRLALVIETVQRIEAGLRQPGKRSKPA